MVATEDRSMRLLSPVRGTTLFTAFPNMVETQIREIEHDIPSATMWMLGGNGEISVYTTTTNPAKIVDIWEREAGTEQVVCMCALRKNCHSEFITDRVYALLGGTVAGQIVVYCVNVEKSKPHLIIQAHSAEVIALQCHADLMLVISLGRDGLMKFWKMEIGQNSTEAADAKPSSVGGQKPPNMLSLSFMYSLVMPTSTGHIIGFRVHVPSKSLAVSTSHNIVTMFTITESGVKEKPRHPNDEDHSKPITSMACLETLCIFASSSTEGAVKIWDGYGNTLLKEVQFGSNVLAICFCNKRGDLLIGTSDQVILLKLQDYLPSFILLELLFRSSIKIIDDLDEVPITFDDQLDFWQLYRDNLIRIGRDLSKWHLAEEPAQAIPKEDELDISKKLQELEDRRAEAKLKEAESVKRPSVIKAKESWKQILKQKKNIEKNVSTPKDTPSKSPKLGAFPKSPLASSERESVVDDRPDLRDLLSDEEIEELIRSGFDDEDDELGTLEDQIATQRRRVSSYGTYRHRQSLQVENELNKDYLITRLQSRGMDDGTREMGMLPEVEKTIAAKKRKSLIKGTVSYQKNRTAGGFGDDNDPTRLGAEDALFNPSIAGKKGQKGRRKSKLAKAVVDSGPTADLRKGIMEPAQFTLVVTEDETAMQNDKKDEEDDLAPVDGILRNPMAALPKVSKKPKKKQRINLKGIALPNSVAAVKIQSEQQKFQHRRTTEDGEDVYEDVGSGDGLQVKSPVPITRQKSFALPEYLRSRRKRDTSVVPVDVGVKSEDVPELSDFPDDQDEHPPPAPIETKSITPPGQILPPIDIRPLLKEQRTSAVKPKPKTPPPRRESSTKSLNESIESVSEADTPSSASEEESSAPSTKEPSRPPSIHEPSRRPSIHEPKAPSARQSIDLSGLLLLQKSRSPSVLPSTQNLTKPVEKKPPVELVPPKPVPKPSRVSIQRAPSEAALPPIAAPSTPSIAESVPKIKFEMDAQTKLMAQKAWSLLEIAQAQQDEPVLIIPDSRSSSRRGAKPKDDALDFIAAKDWFPGLGGKEANITNILDITMKVMKTGYWREKMEAAKAALYLYHTFENDLPNAIQDLILPQIDFMNDPRWEVRAQFATALGAYKVNHPDIILALIARLKDENEMVQKAVKNSLAIFGISSKESLRNAMAGMGLIPSLNRKQQIQSSDRLDVLLEQLRLRAEAERVPIDDYVERWRRNVINPKNLIRLPSICSTLTYNPKKIQLLTSEEKVVHDLLHQNLQMRLGAQLGGGSVSIPPVPRGRSVLQALNDSKASLEQSIHNADSRNSSKATSRVHSKLNLN
ncbi:WD repeat-containing protein 87 [Rhizoclosmatium sp. JEL0117]|nr:WD repeat-containing protein 87 [Rhizoclosmatium sp. JEL0117]